MPSFWSSVANSEWNRRRSNITPSDERAFEGAVDAFLGHRHARAAQLADRLRRGQRLVHQLGRRHDARDQAGALGLGGIHHAAGEHHVHRLGLADRARQALRAAGAGDDAELDLGLAEARGVGGDDEVAHHRQLAAAAEREAGHRGDDGLAHARGSSPSCG